MAARPDSRGGEKIIDGKYLFTSKVIGKGRFGKVFMGKHLVTGADLAMKVTKADALNLGEVKELKKLKNTENVVRLVEEFQNDKYFILVLEYCNGGDFSQAPIAKTLKGNEVLCRRYFGQLLNGLKAINEKKLLHRDLKPANLLLHGDLETNGVLKIADLGFAKTVGDAGMLESKVGTPLFESPERLECKEYGFPAEMWAAGCILYQWLFGHTAFGNVQSTYQLTRMVADPKWKVSFEGLQVSDELKDLVSRLIVVDPLARLTIGEAREHPWLTGIGVENVAPTAGGGGSTKVSPTKVVGKTHPLTGSLEVVLSKKASVDSMEVSPPSGTTADAPIFPKSPQKQDAGTSTPSGQQQTETSNNTAPVERPPPARKYVDPMKPPSGSTLQTSPGLGQSQPTPPLGPKDPTPTSNSSFGSSNNNTPGGTQQQQAPGPNQQRPPSSAPPENLSLTSFNNSSLCALPSGPPAHQLALEHARVIVSVAEVQADVSKKAVLLGYATFILREFTSLCEDVKKLHSLVKAEALAMVERGGAVHRGGMCPNPSTILVFYAVKIGQEAATEEGFENRYCGANNDPIHEVYRQGKAALDAAALNPDLTSRELDKIAHLTRKFEVRIRATAP